MFGKNSSTYIGWKQEWYKFKNIPSVIDVANIGSSAAANNFDYSEWKYVSGYNLASTPQDMYYDNQILEQYIENIKRGGKMIIALLGEDFIVDRYGDDYHNYKYYGFLNSSRIINYSRKTALLLKICPGILVSRFLKNEIKNCVYRLIKYNPQKNRTKLDLKQHADAMIKSWYAEFGWDAEPVIRNEQKEALERSWEIMCKNLDCCRQHDVEPVIVIMPSNHYLKDLLPDKVMLECFWTYIERIKKDGIRVISFWDDDELQADNCYKTSIFLNSYGKKIFNRKLYNILYGNEEETE